METLTQYIEKSEFTTACAVLQCALRRALSCRAHGGHEGQAARRAEEHRLIYSGCVEHPRSRQAARSRDTASGSAAPRRVRRFADFVLYLRFEDRLTAGLTRFVVSITCVESPH